MAQKETILGNYLNFPRFPLDCESMDYIQENIKHLAIIAQIAGCDRLIIKGCTGSPRSAGYVYVRTGNDLLGEILYFPGGSGARCSIKTENINASANGETFNAAYTMRKLVSGTTGTWSWAEDFTSLSAISNASLKALVDGKAAANHDHDTVYANIRHTHDMAPSIHRHAASDIVDLQPLLDAKANSTHNHDTAYAALNHTHNYAPTSHNHSISDITNLQSTLNSTLNSAKQYTDNKVGAVSAVPSGVIVMWSGAANSIPSGWALCNGNNGTPDLRNKFIVGAGSTYNVGGTGGAASRSITLTTDNLPEHNHTFTTDLAGRHRHYFRDYFYPESGLDNASYKEDYPSENGIKYGSGDTDTDNNKVLYHDHFTDYHYDHSHTGTTDNTGSGEPFTFDNRPPYYALCFIMKL